MEYKQTLNLPVSDFPMKADLPAREPKVLERWEKEGLYQKIRSAALGRKKYILHDGPPYANGDIHIGHALNKILKDMIVKFKTMKGFDSPYIPGWDCHGLPVEHQLFKELKITKHQIDAPTFRKKAHDYAMGFVEKQKNQFKRLGILAQWEKPYLTLNPEFEAASIDAFATLVEKGMIYQSLKPVHWCVSCETALAEAELEYNENHISPSIYILFPVEASEFLKLGISIPAGQKVSFSVWTTTPWTLLANVAVALNPEFQYVFVQTKNHGIVIAVEELVDGVMKSAGYENPSDTQILFKKTGKELDGIMAEHPFIKRPSRVVLADYVSRTDGTGCVHTAPGHGVDDYRTGVKNKLETLMPVNEKGVFKEEAGDFKGQFIFKANPKIIEVLEQNGNLLQAGQIKHSYPTCWRCKTPVITRATRQWFMSVDKFELRHKLLETIRKVKWVPEVGQNRISGMVEQRPDWCLSRQRYWGIPVPAFYCQACHEAVVDAALIRHVRDVFKKHGSDAWFTMSTLELTGGKFTCPKCSRKDLKKGEDILDVWFESGTSHVSVLIENEAQKFPADLYLEGSDQHRGWFQSSLLVSVGMSGRAPYETVLTHGFIVDGEGKKMSKSVGNVISPQDVMKEFGADILRLWVASSDTSDDIRISKESIARLADGYRKIRNTFKYLLGNIHGFNPEKDALKPNELLEVDAWALSRFEALKEEVNSSFESFAFHRAYHAVYNFCVKDLSSFYLDVLKDRLYTDSRHSISGRSSRTVLHEILTGLAKILAPVLSFTSEEVWQFLGKTESIHLEAWPKPQTGNRRIDLEQKYEKFLGIRDQVLKALEEKREKKEIGNSLEAEVELAVSKADNFDFLKSFKENLPSLFLVSGVELAHRAGLTEAEFTVTVRSASGQKCERCWNWRKDVGSVKAHPTICRRCAEAVEGV